jgi:hypothetical protein
MFNLVKRRLIFAAALLAAAVGASVPAPASAEQPGWQYGERIRRFRQKSARLATSLVLVLTALLAGAVTQASPASAASSCQFMPYGDIGWYWQLMGGRDFIGCPTSNDESNDYAWYSQQHGYGRIRDFDDGKIYWFPRDDGGPFLMMLKSRPGQPAQLNWWDAYNQWGYHVKVIPSAHGATWEFRQASSSGTQLTMNLEPGQYYQVYIEGCADYYSCYGNLPMMLLRSR